MIFILLEATPQSLQAAGSGASTGGGWLQVLGSLTVTSAEPHNNFNRGLLQHETSVTQPV